MNIRRLGTIAGVVLSGVVLAPVAAAALPRVELSTDIAPGRLAWKTAGMPDLDQIRATTSTVAGLPGDGTQYCGPTTAVNLLSYLARAGFRTGVDGTTDFAAPDGYTAATDAIRAMGVEMPTSATGGTGVIEFVRTFENHLGRAAAVGTLHSEGGSYRSSGGHPPTPEELAEIGIDGAVVAAILGLYTTKTDSTGTYYQRAGGHFATLAGVATMRPYSTAKLTFADPWTVPVLDTTQSPYQFESYGLTMTTARVKPISGAVATQEVGFLDGVFAGWQFEGYVALYPERYLLIRDRSLLRFTPKPFFDTEPELQRYDLGGAVIDAAFSPRTGRPFALLGSGAVVAVGIGPGGKGGRMADQRIARVAGATSLDVLPTGDVIVAGGTALRIAGANGIEASAKTASAILDVVVEPEGGIVVLTGKGRTIERFDWRLKRGAVRRLASSATALDLDAKGIAVPAPAVRGADAALRDDHGAVVATVKGTLSVRGGEGTSIVKPRSGLGRLVAVHRGWELFDEKSYPGPIDTELRSPIPFVAGPPSQPQPQ
jgi:hypothetical protein